MTRTPPSTEVLLITADRALIQRGQRVIAAARHTAEVCEPQAAKSRWPDAAAVLVGVDSLAELVALDLSRRGEVYVIAADRVPDEAWRDCVSLGVSEALALDESEGWLVDRLSLDSAAEPGGRILCVRGAVGGAGTSAVCAALALAAGPDPAVLLDTDLRGGWLDLLLGIEMDGLGWAELAGLHGRVEGAALAASVPGLEWISLVTADRDHVVPALEGDALRSSALAAAGLGGTVIIDDVGDRELSPLARQVSDALIIVTTTDLRGGLAVRRALAAAAAEADDLGRSGLVLVAARTPRRPVLRNETFRELAAQADDIVWVRETRTLDARIARGRPGLIPRDMLVDDCREILRRLADEPAVVTR